MNTYIKLCRKQSPCRHCEKMILKGTYMVVCQWYLGPRIKDGKEQRWWKSIRFHPQCWIEQGITKLREQPVVETRGRKMIPMADDIRAARLGIMMRRASVVQRIRREVTRNKGNQNIERIVHLGGMLNKMREEIEEFGGAPKSWI